MTKKLLTDDDVFGSASSAGGLLSDDEVFGSAAPAAEKKRSISDVVGDVVVTGLKGAIGLPESIVGLADIPTGGRVGKALEEVGYRPREAKQILDTYYSDAQQEANRKVQQADGFVDTLKTAIDNPSTIATAVGESLPQMLGGAGIARGVLKVAPKIGAVAAGAAGEGIIAGGSAAESIRGETKDGLLTPTQSGAAVASGIGTGLLGFVGGKLAQRLGIGDVDTMLASGTTQATTKNFARQMIEAGVSEGVFEELPQSIQEKMWENFALGKPIDQGVGNAAAMGLLAGAAMGGAGGGYNAFMGGKKDGQEIPNGDGATSLPPGQQPAVSAADVLGVPQQQEQTAAEKALYEPKSLTALDRVQEIDSALPNATEEEALALQEERNNITKTWPAAVPGVKASFTTEAGARVEAQYALMEAGDLVTSHDENLRQNPLYPQELQPRERDRAASEMQVSGIVQKLDPARLGESADAANGAPIVGADGLVESGNARTIALKRVYQANGQKANEYKQFIIDNAERFGITPESVQGMQKPVLVRVRSTPVNRAEFARQANASTVAQMSPSEQAKADASRIDDMADLMPDDNGDFGNTDSRGFVRRFMAKLPGTEQAGMIDANGNLSQTGYARIRNAVLAKAYGDSPVLMRMVESMDDNLRNVTKALMKVAPQVAKVRQNIADGVLFDSDITPDLMAAVTELSRLKDEGKSVRDALAQQGMFGGYSEETRDLLAFLDENIRRPKQMAEFIQRYFDALEAAGNPNQGSLLGDTAAPAKGELMTAAKRTSDATGTDTTQDTGRRQPAGAESTGGEAGKQQADAQGREGGDQGDAGKRAAAERDLAQGLDDLGAILRNRAGVTAMIKEEDFPDLLPTLTKIFGAAFRIVGYDMKKAAAYVRDELKKYPALKKVANFIKRETMEKAAQAALNAPAEEGTTGQQDLFSQPVRPEKGATADLFGQALRADQKQPGETDKQFAKRVVDKRPAPASLPERHGDYFLMEGATVVPVANLVSTKSDEESQQGGDNGPKRMIAAARGELSKRAPITVMPTIKNDGKYEVVDGNGTLTSVKKYGWKNLPVNVVSRAEGERILAQDKFPLPKDQFAILDDMYDKARAAHAEYKQIIESIAETIGAKAMVADIKGRVRAHQKILSDYIPDGRGSSAIKDLLRATIVIDTPEHVEQAIAEIERLFPGPPKPKRNLLKEGSHSDDGYRDVFFNVTLPNGLVTEIQINFQAMIDAKMGEGHKLFEQRRSIEARKGIENRELTAEEVAEVETLNAKMRDLYDRAWAQFSRALNSDSEIGRAPSLTSLSGEIGRISLPTIENASEATPSGPLDTASQGSSSGMLKSQNLNPSGNLSGSFMALSSDSIVADSGAPAYTGNENQYNGVVNEQQGNPGAGGTEGQGAGTAQATGGKRKAQGVRQGSGDRDLVAGSGNDAGAANQGEVGQAGSGRVRGKNEDGRGAKPGNRAGRNAGVPAGRDIPVKTGRNYAFGDNDLTYEGPWLAKARQNVEALELLKQLEQENRQATREEQAVLAKFIGWGSSEIANSIFGDKLNKQLRTIDAYDRVIAEFDRLGRDKLNKGGRWRGDYADSGYYEAASLLRDAGKMGPHEYPAQVTREQIQAIRPDMQAKKWAELRDRMKKTLTAEEWASASRSTQYAHYTSKPIVQSMMSALQRMGFKGGSILEPGAGIGVFPGLMPAEMATNSVYTGVEFDQITGGILKQLFPDERILVESFVDTALPANYYDVGFGNPPFGDIPILADPKYKKHAFLLHDYFFAKTIDSVKPGGLVVFVTSNGTMDKRGDKARQYMAERADLVGAVRLPQTAFKKNAGTEVVTDVLFLRKKVEGETFEHGQDFLKSVPIDVNGKQFSINEYFVNHPEMVLGTHSSEGSMYAKDSYTVLPKDGDIEQLFNEAAASLPADIFVADRGTSAEAAKVRELDFNPKAQKEGNYYVTDAGVLMVREGGIGSRVDGKNEKDVALLKDFVSLRDALKQAHYDQLNNGEWEASLASLQKAYSAFVKKNGQVNQFQTYMQKVKVDELDENGEPTGQKVWDEEQRYRYPLLDKIQDDPDWTLVAALEEVNGDTVEIKESAFLTGRVLGKPDPVQAQTPTDALLQVLNETGTVNIPAIADKLGLSDQETIDALGALIYDDPSQGWVTSDEYLSGDVRKKLKAAEAVARTDKRYQRNVEALISVLPTNKTHSEITPQIGMPWIPESIYEQFLAEKAAMDVKVSYNERTGQWDVMVKDSSYTQTWQEKRAKKKGSLSMAATQDWGTDRRNAAEIMQYALTGAPVRIMSKQMDGTKEKDVFDQVATEAAVAKVNQMREAFKSWLWEDPVRIDNLVPVYNDRFNTIVPRKFDGSHMTLPGTSKRYSIFDHVKRGAWRIIQAGNTYLAHAVGSGKTFQMIISAMEQKRLGLIKKPMMVVPNHMLQQFAREWQDLYPAARLMVADENNFTGDNRRRFVSRVALSDLDGVIITQSAFKLLDLDPEFKQKMIEQELDFLRAALAELGGSEDTDKKGKSRDPKVKQIEKRIERMEQKLEAAMSSTGKDKNVRFDEMGVDMLYVDEAHEYRKLAFTTQRQVKGIDSNGSDKAFDLHMKVQWLRENKNPKRNLVMASGTPVTNTLAEIYSVQRFMAPDVLADRGLDEFDQWASMFGAESTAIEPDASGKYGPVTRFNKFVNVSELTQMFREFADVLTSDYLASLLGDKRPKVKGGSRVINVTPKTEQYADFQKYELQPRMERSRQWKPSKDEPNNPDPIIKIIGDGRLAAIDMRFIDPSLPNDPESKLNKMIDEVIRVYKETADWEYKDKATGKVEPNKGATQIVFSDLGFGAGVTQNRGFNARAWFEKRLRDAGVSPSHVAFMSDHKKSASKLKLFKDINAGRVRIVVGSSKNMGTGVNAQQRLIALHHLDSPWYPADLEQREGRIVRQGNKNPEVQLYAYATKGSYDEQMWSTLARKQFFIDQALSGDPNIREIEDLGESSQFEIAAAMVADDPRVLQLAGLRAEVEKLNRLYQAHEDQRGRMQRDFDTAGARLAMAQRDLDAAEKDAAKVQDLSGDNFKAKADGKTFDTRKEWGAAIMARFKDLSDHLVEKDTVIGQISGFDVVYAGYGKDQKRFMAEISVKASEDIVIAQEATADPVGVALRAGTALANIARRPAELRRTVEESKAKQNAIAPGLNAQFPMYQMLLDKQAEARALEEEIVASGQKLTGLEREQQLEDEWQARTGAITPLFSRGNGSGMPLKDLKAVAAKVVSGFKNLPKVHVMASPSEAPKDLQDFIRNAGAWDDVEGATHNGEIYLFASGLSDAARAEHVLATHEVTHYGLRGAIGKSLDSALQHVWLNNGKVRKAAAALRARNGLTSDLEAVEEVLADMPNKDLVKLNGWKRIVKAVRDWLNSVGATNLAAKIDGWILSDMDEQQKADLFVADLVRAAREWVRTGKAKGIPTMAGTRLADGTLQDDLEAQEKWLTTEARARGYADIEDMLVKDYPLFEKLAVKWRNDHPVDGALLSRSRNRGDLYRAYAITDADRESLLKQFPATHRRVIADHITAQGMTTMHLVKEGPAVGQVIGMMDAEGMQALVVTVNGEELAGDGTPFHISWSADYGVQSGDAGKLIKKHGFTRLQKPVDIDLSAGPTISSPLKTKYRAEALLKQKAATWAPVEAVMRTLSQATGLQKLTSRIYDKAEFLIDRYTPEQIKAGVVSDYGVPEAVIDRRVAMQAAMKQQLRQTGELIERLATLTRAESRVAYEWMNNNDPQVLSYFESQLPAESLKTLEEVKAMIDQLSRKAVELGQLDPEAYKRNRFEYLRRSYVKHTGELTKREAANRQRAIAILGDQYKGRGMTDAVDMAKFKNVAPEWWNRKLKAGQADKQLKGEKFIRLEKRKPMGEGVMPLEEMQGPGNPNPQQKGKLLEVAYWPAGEAIPTKYQDWDHAGTWEVRDTKGNNLIVWRDFTKQERIAMGEIDEARYAIAKTLHGMVHDIETGNFLEWIADRYAKKPGESVDGGVVEASERMRDTFAPGTWVQVPETKIPGTSVMKYGKLAGRFIPGPIWNDVRQSVGFRFQPLGETYAAILGAWKTAKTALSPAVHTNNVMANMVMADWHDVTAGHMLKALRIILGASQRDGKGLIGRTGNALSRAGIPDAESAREIINRFQESGANLGSWVTTELQKEQLEPLLDALEKELALAGETVPGQVGVMVALQKALQLRFPSAWEAFKPTVAGRAVTTEAANLIKLYEAEDQVFRLAAWLKAKEDGAADTAAGKIARRSFLDYHINAPWIQAMRNTAFPFISFTYRSVPMLLEVAAKKPHKLLKLALVAGAINALGYLGSGGDEDDERALLPEEKAGKIWGMVPKLVRMPWNDANNQPVFLDIRRFVPVGDIFDTGATNAALPVLPAMVPGGPMAVLAEVMLNKVGFTGKEITLETDTAAEKLAKVADHLYKAFAPNIIILPGSHAFTGTVNAATGRTDSFGREMSTAQAVATAFGVKLGSYPKDVLQLNTQRAAQAKLMEIDRNITQLKRELQRNGISEPDFRKKVDEQIAKKQKVVEDLQKKMGG